VSEGEGVRESTNESDECVRSCEDRNEIISLKKVAEAYLWLCGRGGTEGEWWMGAWIGWMVLLP